MAKKAYVYNGSAWEDLASSNTDLTNYPNMTTTPISGFRNAIINGDFRINQRRFTSNTANVSYNFDRFLQTNSGGTVTCTPQKFTVGSPAAVGYESENYLRQVVSGQSTSGQYASIAQPIEDVRTFAGTTATISFWAKAASGTPKIAIELQQKFGSGGSPSSDVFTYVNQVTLSTSWARYSVTVTVPFITGKTVGTTANTSSLWLNLWTSAGSDFNTRSGSLGLQNNTFDVWGIQFERGSIATPFEQRPIGTELALCQRYYWKSNQDGGTNVIIGSGIGSSATQAYISVNLPVEMRVAPTPDAGTVSNLSLAQYGIAANALTALSDASTNKSRNIGFVLVTVASGSAGSAPFMLRAANASGYLAFSAEL